MKIEFEEKDLDAIAQRVLEMRKPSTQGISKPPETHLLDVNELAEYLGVNKAWVYDHKKRGEIPYIKLTKYLRFKKSEVDKWLE